MTTKRGVLLLGLLLALSVAVRIAALGVEGHNGDVRVTSGWAERMAEVGPWRFYEGSGSIYPALLYPLWAIGTDLDGDALAVAIKGLSIPFDLALGIGLWALMRGRTGEIAALGVAALYLLNPATILAGPVWGQVDSAGTLPYLAALVALAARQYGLAGGLAVLATMIKPQFGLAVLPVLAVAAIQSRSRASWEPMLRSIGGMGIAYVIIAAPLALHPLRYLGLLGDTAVRQPMTSLHAFNPWGLFIGFNVPDAPYVGLGTALLLLGVAGSMLGLRRRPDLAVVLAVGAALVLAFYFLPTRVHERYLFPALAMLAPFALAGRREMIAYVALSLSFAASLLYALHETTPFDLPEPVAAWIVSDAGVWVIGLVLIGSAVAWAWMLIVEHPRLPGRDRVPGSGGIRRRSLVSEHAEAESLRHPVRRDGQAHGGVDRGS
jgi:dolichyl-phosphate-mannose-protein mannosyltransferase